MFSDLFLPRHIKAQKQIAKSAGMLRQRAATNFQIELGLLERACSTAEAFRRSALISDRADILLALSDAITPSSSFREEVKGGLHAPLQQLEVALQYAVATNEYRALADQEHRLIAMFESLTVEARQHLSSLNQAMGNAVDAGLSHKI